MVASRNTIYDFIRRTEANLKTIETLAFNSKDKYFEVTQLINPAVGILMWPIESLLDQLPDDFPIELVGAMPITIYGAQCDYNFRTIVKNIRNAMAHHNLDFESRNNIIIGLYVWSQPSLKEKSDWVGYISIKKLRTLLLFLSKEFGKFQKKGVASNMDSFTRLEHTLADELKHQGKSGLRLTNPISFE